MKTALTIAGSDSSGGAGIQADIKTMTCNGVFAMSAITALTAQNTTGVTAIMEVKPEFLKEEIKAVVTDIFPDAVKTGMVSSTPLIKVISDSIKTAFQTGLKTCGIYDETSKSEIAQIKNFSTVYCKTYEEVQKYFFE